MPGGFFSRGEIGEIVQKIRSPRLNFGAGKVFFVDADTTVGSDSNPGEDPKKPLLTIARALALCRDGEDDHILIRGNFQDSPITITKNKVHLIGLSYGGHQLSYLSRINPGDSDHATILIQAQDVEIANLAVLGNRGAGDHYPAIFADGDSPSPHEGTRSYIHDCYITMLTPKALEYANGIDLRGDRHTVENCVIDSQLIGVRVFKTAHETSEILILNNIIYACNTGIDIQNLDIEDGAHGAIVAHNMISGEGAEDATGATGINIAAGGGAPLIIRNFIGGYLAPGATNGASATFIENYEETGGGTLINI